MNSHLYRNDTGIVHAARRLVRLLLVALVALVLAPKIPLAQSPLDVNNASRYKSRYENRSLTIDYDGFTAPKYDILVAATEIGRLADVNVHVGDRVEKGDVVAKLEDGLQSEAVATAKWRAQMHGEIDAAKAETALMSLRLEQLKTLAAEDVTRPDELKRALADWEVAKAQELAAIEQGRLRELELSRYQLQLQRRKILAPMSGVVAEVFRAPGEYITPADPAVIRLVVVDELYGVFNVPVEEIDRVKVGGEVSVYLSSVAVHVSAKVVSVSPDIDGESGTIQVRVLLDNREGRLRAGDRCQMKPVASRTGGNVVPQRRASMFDKMPRMGVRSHNSVSGVR